MVREGGLEVRCRGVKMGYEAERGAMKMTDCEAPRKHPLCPNTVPMQPQAEKVMKTQVAILILAYSLIAGDTFQQELSTVTRSRVLWVV